MLRVFFTGFCIFTVTVNSAVLHQNYDVIVVGLGSAGTTAASVLAKGGRRVLALEAQNRIGGRVQTVAFGDGIVELGAEWIHGIKNSFTYETATNNSIKILIQDDGYIAYFSNGSIFDNKLMGEMFSLLAEYTHDEAPQPLGDYLTARVKNFLERNYPHLLNDTDSLNEILDFLNRAECGVDGSNDWVDVTTASKYERLEGSQDASWHSYGYKTFFEILLNTYKGGPGLPNLSIKLNSEVTRISYPEASMPGLVQVTTADGVTYEAENVIVTISLGVLQEGHKSLFQPPLPTDKITAIEKISIGVVDKIIFYFEEPWWPKNVNVFPFVWRGEDRRKVPEHDKWLLKVFGGSLSMGSNKTFVYWIHGTAAKQMEALTDDIVQKKLLNVTRMFMEKTMEIPEPISMIRSTWYSNPFTRGSYSFDNNLTPQYPNAREILARPIMDKNGRCQILFAGEATNTNHYSTVHGAAETGYREALRLLPK